MKTLLALALASVSMAASAPAATAMPDYRETSAVVPYHDLDLSTPEGRAQLDRRVTTAARRLCSPAGPPTLAESRMTADCMASAKARASSDIRMMLASILPPATEVAQVRVGRALRP